MYTNPPVTGFIILSIIGILLISTIPIAALTLYQHPAVSSPTADTTGDAKINAQNKTFDINSQPSTN